MRAARADIADGLNLYNAYMGVNGVDPLGLWSEAGVIDEYTNKHGDDPQAMQALLVVLSQYSLTQGDYYLDDWGVNHNARTISIASNAWFGSERSDANAAEQLYQILSDEFYEVTGMSETWGGAGRRVGGGVLKTAGGAGSCVGDAALFAVPEPTTLTKIGGAGACTFGANMTVDGVTQIFNRSGGINLINNALGAYGQWMAGDEGEAQARFWGSMSEFFFTGAGNLGKTSVGNMSIRQMPAATKEALKNAYIKFSGKSYIELYRPYIRKSTIQSIEANAVKIGDNFVDANTGEIIIGKYHLGHKYGHEFRKYKNWAETKGMTQAEFNDLMNNPDLYQIESPILNSSHIYEAPDNVF